VIDRVEVATRHRQEMAALAIRVVDDRVEDRDLSKSLVVAHDHPDDVDLRIDVDPALDHPVAEWTLAEQCRRHDAPAHRLRDQVGRDLAARQRADREVEERLLTPRRFPYREEILAGSDADDHRVVRGSAEPSDDLQLPVAERNQDIVGRDAAHVVADLGLS